jgi:poly-gamma-glutamate capsule biosynthesis protein CapA/YwtB (metallophosphatase superfamily)
MVNSPVTILMTGDVMLGRQANEAIARFGPRYPWGDLRQILVQADLTIVNLECVIARSGRPWSRWPKVFHFRAGPDAVNALQEAGVDCVTLANNHVLDFEEEALWEMLGLLRGAGIACTGAGRDLDEARAPALLEARGLRVAVLAYTDNEPGWAARGQFPGTNYIPIGLGQSAFQTVRFAIEQACEDGAHLVIVTAHLGPNMVERPDPCYQDFARAVIDAGAHLFFGHSAHIFQGIELYKGRPIVHDAGDFVDDYAVNAQLRNDRGLLFRLEAGASGIRRIELIPTLIARCQVNLAPQPELDAVAARVEQLSSEMGTTLQRCRDRLFLELR